MISAATGVQKGEADMAKDRKNKKQEKLPEVLTAHREKAERESGRDGDWEQDSDRPNGTTGNYS